MLARAWCPNGWNYIRRSVHLSVAGSDADIVRQHQPYIRTISSIGRGFEYTYFRSLLETSRRSRFEREHSLNIYVGLARLAGFENSARGTGREKRYYRHALRYANAVEE